MLTVTSDASPGNLIDLISAAPVVDLSHRLVQDMPVAPTHPGYVFTLARRHGDRPRSDGVCTANEVLVLSGHTGTHIDALGHASRDGVLHGGRDAYAVQSGGRGLKALGVETIAPVICRGVLLDIAGLHGVDCLAPGYEVTVQDLEQAQDRHEIQIRAGDAVLVRTGWARHWSDRDAFIGSETGTPGPGPAAARWMIDRGVRVSGDDTLTYEVVRPGIDVRPVHGLFLVDAGVHIVEALNLEELAGKSVGLFLFVLLSLPLVGATGSPVRPIAVLA